MRPPIYLTRSWGRCIHDSKVSAIAVYVVVFWRRNAILEFQPERTNIWLVNRFLRAVAVLYAALVVYIIFCANTSRHTLFFDLVRATPGGDKAGHFFLMGLLALAFNLSLGCRMLRIANRPWLTGSLILLVVVTAEELSQIFVATRSFDLVDLAFDYLGISVFGKVAVRIHTARNAAEWVAMKR